MSLAAPTDTRNACVKSGRNVEYVGSKRFRIADSSSRSSNNFQILESKKLVASQQRDLANEIICPLNRSTRHVERMPINIELKNFFMRICGQSCLIFCHAAP